MDYTVFKAEFLKLSTIDLNAYKEKQMKRRIDSLIEKSNCVEYSDFLAKLKVDKELYETFINYLTINVSEFYRNPSQWEILEREIIPSLIKKNGVQSEIRIWSSACSTGDEPYTLAMVLSKFIPLSKIKIIATDIDLTAIAKAKNGIYPTRSLKELPLDFLNKFFTKVDDYNYRINDEVKKCVDFRQMNLLRDKYPDKMDLIVCRNVLIYFTEEAKNDIYIKFNNSLVEGGILFIGSTEQIIGAQKFGYKAIKTFFYEKTENVHL